MESLSCGGRPGYGQSAVFFLTVPCLSAHLLACLYPHHHHQASHCHHVAVDDYLSLLLANITTATIIYSFYIYIIIAAAE